MGALPARVPCWVPPSVYPGCPRRITIDTRCNIRTHVAGDQWPKLAACSTADPVRRCCFPSAASGRAGRTPRTGVQGGTDSHILRGLAPRRPSRSGAVNVLYIAFPCQRQKFPSNTIFTFLSQRVLDVRPLCRKTRHDFQPLPCFVDTCTHPCRSSMSWHSIAPGQRCHQKYPTGFSSC